MKSRKQTRRRRHPQPTNAARRQTEPLGMWTDMTARVVNDFFELTTDAARENVRALSDLQDAGLDAWRAGQIAALEWQRRWPELFRNPLGWYQQTLDATVESLTRSMDVGRRGAETLTRSVDRMQDTAAGTARTVRRRLDDGGARLRAVRDTDAKAA